MSLWFYVSCPHCDEPAGSRNITHNLAKMARECGVYMWLWRPEEVSSCHASELVEPLEKGLALLKSDPRRFSRLNPENGWGDYEGLVEFVEWALELCRKHPHMTVMASR